MIRQSQSLCNRGTPNYVDAVRVGRWTAYTFLLLGILVSPLAHQAQATIIADSAAQFSSVQGQDGWYYGYVAPASGPDFIPFTLFQTNYPGGPAWVIDPLQPTTTYPYYDTHTDHYFTLLWADRGMDNALITSANKPAEQWDDRRWISTVSGNIDISGRFGIDTLAYVPDEDGATAEILVDGIQVWSRYNNGQTDPISPYDVSTTVSVGSVIDFVVKPGANDFLDDHDFTAVITTPEPSTFALAALGGLALLALRRRQSRG